MVVTARLTVWGQAVRTRGTSFWVKVVVWTVAACLPFAILAATAPPPEVVDDGPGIVEPEPAASPDGAAGPLPADEIAQAVATAAPAESTGCAETGILDISSRTWPHCSVLTLSTAASGGR